MRDQADEINAMQDEFGNASALMDSKYKQLNDNFKELE